MHNIPYNHAICCHTIEFTHIKGPLHQKNTTSFWHQEIYIGKIVNVLQTHLTDDYAGPTMFIKVGLHFMYIFSSHHKLCTRNEDSKWTVLSPFPNSFNLSSYRGNTIQPWDDWKELFASPQLQKALHTHRYLERWGILLGIMDQWIKCNNNLFFT